MAKTELLELEGACHTHQDVVICADTLIVGGGVVELRMSHPDITLSPRGARMLSVKLGDYAAAAERMF